MDDRPLRRGKAADIAWTAACISLRLTHAAAHAMPAPLPQLRNPAGDPQSSTAPAATADRIHSYMFYIFKTNINLF